jgi:hypothetical protein
MDMKRTLDTLPLLLFLLFVGIGSAVAAIQVNPTTLNLEIGKTRLIAVTNATGTVKAWTSNPSVTTVYYVNGAVKVKGLFAGTATIKIKDANSFRQVAVKVISPKLALSPNFVSASVGAVGKVSVLNANGTVSVFSLDKTIATAYYANNTVTVKGIKAGSTTVKVKDQAVTRQIKVSVIGDSTPPATSGNYTLLAWNDLGMHCMDGNDFSVFTILPPYNTLHAQLKDKSGKLVTSGVELTYQAIADNSGSINTTSYTKTNFWDWSGALFGLTPAIDIGLNLDGLATGTPEAGNETPSLTPAPMAFNQKFQWFEAEGIPVTPYDDTGRKNYYPAVRVVAKDAHGNVLATAKTILPVSDEMTCKACHASTTSTNPAQTAAKPKAGWIFDPNREKDWKRNILRLHDERKLSTAVYQSALIQMGYNTAGLLKTADSGKPVLCVSCHASNAYYDKKNEVSVMGGLTGIRPFTQVLHLKHALVKDPATQLALDSTDDRTACYLCHPGSKTKCLRGAMGKAVDAKGDSLMSCQSCHGNMAAVGSPARKGWFNEPTCESCHNSSAPNRRAISGVKADGTAIVPADHTFATNANTPVSGLNLYRFSKGHGGLQCEACHGSTHAEYPSLHADENDQSIAVQGHAGPVAECTACHKTVPRTVNGGPHGMHTTGDSWVEDHKDAAEHGGTAGCTYCHGDTAKGTPLSAIKVAKTINADEFGIKQWPAGYQVSCYSCHNGPNPD